MAVIVQVVVLNEAKKDQQENRKIFSHKKPPPVCESRRGRNTSRLQTSSESVFATKLQAIRSIYIFKLGITNFGVEVELAAHSGRNASFA